MKKEKGGKIRRHLSDLLNIRDDKDARREENDKAKSKQLRTTHNHKKKDFHVRDRHLES
jgi:hypothetical protein